MADVGEALVGPFDRYLSEYDKMRRAAVDDRRDEEWPTINFKGERADWPQSPTPMHTLESAERMLNLGAWEIPNLGRLGIEAGGHDINAPTKEELLKFLMVNEATGPDAPSHVPLPRPRPRGR